MWTAQTDNVSPQTVKLRLNDTLRPVTFRQVLELWRNNDTFREYFTALLNASPFDAFFWETPPVSDQTLERPFECVLVHSSLLSTLQPDPAPFASQFSSQRSAEILTFPNLGGDAVLVVPAPVGNIGDYTHLAKFLKHGPRLQINAFWRAAGVAMQNHISSNPSGLAQPAWAFRGCTCGSIPDPSITAMNRTRRTRPPAEASPIRIRILSGTGRASPCEVRSNADNFPTGERQF